MISGLDFGAEKAVVLIAEKREDESWNLLGAGDADVKGVQGGEITHLGDAVETVVEAVKKAELRSGSKIETLYFNFDDPKLVSLRARGSKTLAGEGEIERSDIADARRMVERIVNDFQRTIIYAKEVGFLIDDRDTVENPVGVFGRKLDVEMHILQARSERCEVWKKMMRRAHLERSVLVPTAWSTAYGVLHKEDRRQKRFIADLGTDTLNFFLFQNNGLTDVSVALNDRMAPQDIARRAAAAFREWQRKNPELAEILVTGDLALDAKILETLRGDLGVPVNTASAFGISKLSAPKFSSAVGLLSVAEELERRSSALRPDRGLLENVKERAVSFINEYF